MLRLSVLVSLKNAPVSIVKPLGGCENSRTLSSPEADSILITSAPRLASSSVTSGPAAIQQKSSTRTPASGSPPRSIAGRGAAIPPSRSSGPCASSAGAGLACGCQADDR